MITNDRLVSIKWAGPNSPYFEIERNNARLYPTKRELVSIRDAINMFLDAYPEDFTKERINFEDVFDDNWDNLCQR